MRLVLLEFGGKHGLDDALPAARSGPRAAPLGRRRRARRGRRAPNRRVLGHERQRLVAQPRRGKVDCQRRAGRPGQVVAPE